MGTRCIMSFMDNDAELPSALTKTLPLSVMPGQGHQEGMMMNAVLRLQLVQSAISKMHGGQLSWSHCWGHTGAKLA